MSNFDNIIRDIQNAELKTRAGREKLEARVRAKYKIRDIMLVADFLHGGVFISTAEPSAESLLRKVAKGEKVEIEWTRSNSGIVTRTYEEDRELENLWKRIVQSCHLNIGAASVLQMAGARLFGGYALADEGEGPTLYDYTLNALVLAVPKKYRKSLDLILAVKSNAAQGAENGVAKSLPRLMRQLANAEPGDPDPLAPPPRAPGAGRPRKYDLDGKQVEDAYFRIAGSPEAQSFTAICAQLIRNPPKGSKYQKPYKSPKALLNAVKRAHRDIDDLRLK